MTLPLSVTIIAFNEVDRIARAINSVQGVASEVIVVDSGSIDGTAALAESLGANVYHRSWTGYGEQKQYAESLCAHQWVLNMDADEAASTELLNEIRALFLNAPAHVAYRIGMQDILPGQRKPSRFNYVKWHIRLYHRDHAGFNTSTVHDVVEVREGSIGTLKQPMLHYSARSVAHSIDKLNRYSTMQADNLGSKGKKISLLALKLCLIFPAAFFKSYVLRKNALLGTAGFVNSIMYAFSRFARLAKHWEQTR
jgi:glycosyltransferase involved in cell wall biosynthesis